MNYNKRNYLACVLSFVSLTTECMFLALAKSKRLPVKTNSSGLTSQRYFSCKNQISGRQLCSINHQIEETIWNATQYPHYENFYAETINNLLKLKVAQDAGCCHNVNIHLAVLADLPTVAYNLLEANPNIVNTVDVNGSLPIDLAEKNMSLLLKKYGSVEKSSQPQLLKYVRVPKFGWIEMTPLKRAILEGDLEETKKKMQRTHLDDKEKEKLRMIALVLYWRSKKDNFLKIACYLETGYLQKSC